MPRISVVVPAYNNGPFVAAALQSVLDQTYEDFELIVADHASADDTLAQIEPFADDPRVQIHYTAAGGGAVANWNAVSQRATGEFIKLLPADDLLHPTALAKQVAAFNAAGSEVNLVATQRSLIDATGRMRIKKFGLGRLEGIAPGTDALRATVRSGTNLFGEPGCVTMRTDALAAAGWWQPLRYYIDAGSYAPVLVTGKMVAVREPLASFRLSSTQWSVRLRDAQVAEAKEFHRQAQALAPDHISDADVRTGDRRAWLRARQRRLTYALLRLE